MLDFPIVWRILQIIKQRVCISIHNLKSKIPITQIFFRSARLHVKEGGYENTPVNAELTTLTVFDFSESRGMQKELALNGPISSNSKIKWQSETCICDSGDLCNATDKSKIDKNILFLLITIYFNKSLVMLYWKFNEIKVLKS